MAPRRYERVSVFQEAKEIHAENGQSEQTPLQSKTPHIHPSNPGFNYKPVILRQASLLTLLLVTGALIGLLQYAVVHLPHSSIGSSARSIEARDENRLAWPLFERRQVSQSISAASTTTTNASDYVQSSSTAAPTTTDASAYVQSSSVGGTSFTVPSAYVQSSSVEAVATTVASAYVDTGTLTISKSSQETTGSTSVIEDTFQSAYVHTSSTLTGADTAQSAYEQISSKAPATYYTTAASAYVETGSMTRSSAYVATKTTSDIRATTTRSGYVSNNSPTASGSTGTASLADAGKPGEVSKPWGAERVFQGSYLAVLIAVIYRMLWTMVFNGFNLIDPFLQLMQPGGATAGTAFFSFYQSQSNLLGPIPAVHKKRWMLAFITTAYTIVGFLPAFASEGISVDTNWGCPNPILKHKVHPCNPRISVDITVVHVLQGLLAFIAATLVTISVYLAFKKTGLPSDPRSMAAIGSLMQHPVLVDDLNSIPTNCTLAEMESSMREKTYTLGFYKISLEEHAYGIKPTVEDNWLPSSRIQRFKYAPVEGYRDSANQNRSSAPRFKIVDLLLLLATLGVFGVVLAYYLDGNSDGFNNFFNSNTFGPRFVLTLAGTVITSMWKSAEQSAITMAPFIRMARKPSPPQATLLFAPSSTPLSSTWRSLRSGYIVVGTITVITLLGEALNITISGVPFASGQTQQQFFVSTYTSLAILGIMIIASPIVMISRSREPRIPRKPETLGPLMSYMSGSHMLNDLESLDARTRSRLLVQENKRYGFKEGLRMDGKVGWRIDQTSTSDLYYTP